MIARQASHRRNCCGLGIALLLGGCAARPASSGGVVSLNPCTDAMLVALAPDRIASLSHYSSERRATSIPLDVAARYPSNAGTAEEVIALRPSLVLASSFTPPATRNAFARAGLNTLYLDSPTTIAESEAQVRALAVAVGRPNAGEAMVAKIDAAAHAAASGRPPVAALLWIGGDLVSGGGTLLDALMRRTGFADAAADYGLTHTGSLPAETLVAHPPQVMLVPDEPGLAASSRAARTRAQLIAHFGTRQFEFPRRLVNCGGPVIVDALARLAAIRRAIG